MFDSRLKTAINLLCCKRPPSSLKRQKRPAMLADRMDKRKPQTEKFTAPALKNR